MKKQLRLLFKLVNLRQLWLFGQTENACTMVLYLVVCVLRLVSTKKKLGLQLFLFFLLIKLAAKLLLPSWKTYVHWSFSCVMLHFSFNIHVKS